jgi:threonine dehydratase
MLTLSIDDFRETRARIAPHIKRTPMLTSRQLSERTGFDIRLKAVLFQNVGSYKIRGPLNKFALMSDEDKRRGVVCSSAGNHAQGVALAAKIHGIRAVVCMAKNATPAKIAATKAYGAEVVLHGMIWDEANEKAKELVRDEGLTYVHPFDDAQLIAGQGTLGLEIVEDWPEVDAVVVPIGGGGLISGVACAVKALRPECRIVGVELEAGPGMTPALAAGKPVPVKRPATLADGLTPPFVGEIAVEVCQQTLDDLVLVTEEEIIEGMRELLVRAKLFVEGSGAAATAALLAGKVKVRDGERVVSIISGGNADPDRVLGLFA